MPNKTSVAHPSAEKQKSNSTQFTCDVKVCCKCHSNEAFIPYLLHNHRKVTQRFDIYDFFPSPRSPAGSQQTARKQNSTTQTSEMQK